MAGLGRSGIDEGFPRPSYRVEGEIEDRSRLAYGSSPVSVHTDDMVYAIFVKMDAKASASWLKCSNSALTLTLA